MPIYLYFFLWGLVFFFLMRFGCGAHIMGHGHRRDGDQPDGVPLTSDQISHPKDRAQQ